MKNLIPVLFLFMSLVSNHVLAQPASPITVIDASNPSACDGSAYITNPNIVNTNSIVWYTNGAILAQGVTSVSNLCAGTYGVYYTTFIDSVYATFFISGNPCNGFMAIVTGTATSSPTAFDGSASVTAVGGTSPYAFSWSNGTTTSTISGLGVGVYTCCVTDMNGCVSCDSFTVSATINPGLDTVFVINNNSIPNTLDSLGTQTMIDCSLDYNAIGSAFISNSLYVPSVNPGSLDSIYLTWQVYDSLVPANLMATYMVGYSLVPPLAQSYTASLQITCPQKTTNYNTLWVTDQFYSAQLGIEDVSLAPWVCVNQNCMELTMSQNEKGQILVYSSTGSLLMSREINSEKSMTIPLDSWNTGMYFLHYNFVGKQGGVVRFVKP